MYMSLCTFLLLIFLNQQFITRDSMVDSIFVADENPMETQYRNVMYLGAPEFDRGRNMASGILLSNHSYSSFFRVER